MERLRGKGADMDRVAALSALQMGVEEKLERADFVLVNNEDSSLLRRQCAELSRLFSGGDRVAPA
jgi:dephospho-CoA kinase